MIKFPHDEAEIKRLQELFKYESPLWASGIQYIAGIDEVGRGPIAGPVVAAAVILPANFMLWGVNDSKKLSENKRLALEQAIKENAVAWAIGAVGARDIEKYNILEATKIAMARAVHKLAMNPEHLLIDALKLPALTIPQTAIIKGDAQSASIAAASILAKCHRDRMMKIYDLKYPGYGFAQNSGYPSPAHKRAVFANGACVIHRSTFVLKPIKGE